jgi:Zn-dependent protease with chaperone function
MGNTAVSAQNIPIKGKATILECKTPYDKVKVDMLGDESDFIQEMAILPDTKITDKKGNPVKLEDLPPGTKVELSGEKVSYKNQLREIKVTVKWAGETVELNGILEIFDVASSVAVIDGQKVKLAAGTTIKGDSKLKGKKFASFAEISLGNRVKCAGPRQVNGIINATSASVQENDFDATDQELRAALGDEFSAQNLESVPVPADLTKYTEALDRGYIQFGDAQFKLYDNLKVQAYVNYIGNKVVPQWQKDIPFEAPERLRFRFYVIENPTFNAFALPNGMIFVHTGLFSMIDNEAQFAAILGHEVAHATYEHAKERYESQKTNKMIGDLAETSLKLALKNIPDADIALAKLLTSDAAQTGIQATVEMARAINRLPPQTKNALKGLYLGLRGVASNNHSKERESQSDRVGLFYMQQAGYDPREASKVWKKFMETTGDKKMMEQMNIIAKQWLTTANMYPYKNPLQSAGDFVVGKMAEKALDNWFSSHPKATTRYRNLNQLVATNYAREDLSGAMVNEEEYKEIKKIIIVK